MAIEQEARRYVRVEGTGKPTIKNKSPEETNTSSNNNQQQTNQNEPIFSPEYYAMTPMEKGRYEKEHGIIYVHHGGINYSNLWKITQQERQIHPGVIKQLEREQMESRAQRPATQQELQQSQQPTKQEKPWWDFLSGMRTQEVFYVPGWGKEQSEEYGIARQQYAERGNIGPSERDIVVGMLELYQAPMIAKGFTSIPKAFSPWTEAIGGFFLTKAAKDIIEEPGKPKQAFDIIMFGGMIGAGAIGGGLKLSDLSNYIKEKWNKIPRDIEVTYFKETGEVNIRNVYNILGKDVRSPFYKSAVGERGLDFFERPTTAEPTMEPPGIAQSPRWKPTTPTDVNVIHYPGGSYIEPIISTRWQPRTGIPEPYILTGREIVNQPFRELLVKEKPGALTEYDPIFQVIDPRVVEINKNLEILNRNWQPKTGIPFPKEEIAKPEPVIPVRSPFDVTFKPRPSKPTIMKVTQDSEGNLIATKYGVTEPASKLWQPQTGTFEEKPRTGKELSTTVFPKPIPFVQPGKLTIYEPILNLFGGLESGQTLQTEGMIRLAPKKKTFTLEDIVKPEVKQVMSGSQVQKGGQETVLIIDEPKTETKTISDLVTDEEQVMMGEQRQEQVKLTEQRQTSESFQQFKPITVQKQNVRSLSMFMPMVESKSEQQMISEIRQEQDRMLKTGIMSISASDVLSRQLQDSMTDSERMSKQMQGTILISNDTIINNTREFTERIAPEKNNPFTPELENPRPPVPFEEEEDVLKPVGPQSYVLQLRKRQYQNGHRINNGKYHDASKPLSWDDALSLGMHTVDQTEKASFQLRESDEKPRRLGRSIPHWSNNIGDFTQTRENRWVEDSRHRMDSPGEIAAITMKGIQARMRR